MQNIKHVQEKLKVPVASKPRLSLEVEERVPVSSRTNAKTQPGTSGNNRESPTVEKAEASTSAKKRSRDDDDAEKGALKRAKVCYPQVS